MVITPAAPPRRLPQLQSLRAYGKVATITCSPTHGSCVLCRLATPGTYHLYLDVNGTSIANSPLRLHVHAPHMAAAPHVLSQSRQCVLGDTVCSGHGFAVDCRCTCDEGWVTDMAQLVRGAHLLQCRAEHAARCQLALHPL
jgi:hypothetical protein